MARWPKTLPWILVLMVAPLAAEPVRFDLSASGVSLRQDPVTLSLPWPAQAREQLERGHNTIVLRFERILRPLNRSAAFRVYLGCPQADRNTSSEIPQYLNTLGFVAKSLREGEPPIESNALLDLTANRQALLEEGKLVLTLVPDSAENPPLEIGRIVLEFETR